MTTYYTIDSGNTNYKVATFSAVGEMLNLEIISNINDFKFEADSKSIFCSVNQQEPKLSNLVSLSELREQLSFKTNYASSLGEDRLATSFYVQKIQPKGRKAILDAGTFITIDLIEDDKHVGGYIYPGIQTFLKSYNAYGKNLPQINFKQKSGLAHFPVNTEQAINEAVNNYLNSIELFLKGLNLNTLYITGGDTELISADLAKETIKNKNLVHQSLLYILRLLD